MTAEPLLLSEKKTVRLRETWSVTLDEAPVALRWAPQLHALAVAPAEGGIVLLDAGDGSIARRWPGHEGGNFSLLGNHDATASVIQISSMKCLRLGGFGGKVAHLAWEPESRAIAGAGGTVISVWDLKAKAEDNQLALPLEGHTAPIAALAWQPGGHLLASGGSDARLLLWQPQSEILPVVFQPLSTPVTQLAWSRDGRHLAVGARDGRVTLFTIETP